MRHGDVSYVDEAGAPVKPEDVPLTPRGREQAAAARDALADVEFDLVVASDLPRTRETAEIVAPGTRGRALAGARGVARRPARRDPARRARGRVRRRAPGAATRRSASSAASRSARRSTASIPRSSGCSRATGTPRSRVLHGGVNRIVISYALSGDRTYFGTFEQAPACINVLDLGDDGWIVRTVNYVPYDPLHPARTTTMEHLWEQLKPFLDERQ